VDRLFKHHLSWKMEPIFLADHYVVIYELFELLYISLHCLSCGFWFQDLEEARAVLEAKLAGRDVEIREKLNPNLVNAMSQIAQGYMTESEEEGEIEHDSLKQVYIETKIKEIVEIIASDVASGPENEKQPALVNRSVKEIQCFANFLYFITIACFFIKCK